MSRLDQKTVANRYARAIFELAQEDGQLDQTYQELVSVRQVFLDNPSLVPLLAGVDLGIKEKQALVDQVKEGASKYVANLLQMAFDYRRMSDMVAIVDEFERRYDEMHKRVHAEVVTAVQLDETRRNQLRDNLAARLGAQEIVLNEKVDPTILGGVVVKTANQTLDGSIKTKIEQIRRLIVK
ncbi:ATP synthase F1 subunit delta [Limosilactobacillus fermentum]|uniref:ATP synthase subunit delta n=1 Tax=Limosilactobacillus fermentum TaxID=1613 RepID=A0AAJ6D1G7_LIMFE|nr:ATP synthase F1 subunit delta [Limosilactobacillus fermentum]MED7635179.1 F0F1 ATP synthase subunit delta [Limosilactobacillus fermentum]UVF13205.1 ATP synthase F1 subunit delta [Limosilactobacillus fermentum]WFR89648.1 ATP synthase F1 subunit delta [Limosilactobacillus fermentum]